MKKDFQQITEAGITITRTTQPSTMWCWPFFLSKQMHFDQVQSQLYLQNFESNPIWQSTEKINKIGLLANYHKTIISTHHTKKQRRVFELSVIVEDVELIDQKWFPQYWVHEKENMHIKKIDKISSISTEICDDQVLRQFFLMILW